MTEPAANPSGADAFTMTLRVRYVDCDPMNVAHHSVYPVWFEIGRTEMLRNVGMRYRDLEAAGVFLAVVSLRIRYRAPARYDDELTLTTYLDRATRVRIDHRYELRRDGRLLATAESTLACIDRDGRPRMLPDELARCVGASTA